MKRALLSVSDKTGIVDFAKGLSEMGYEIVSTGGTAHVLKEAGLKVLSITEVTGFPEILDGRVKTLHPHVHAGLLARNSEEHQATLEQLNIHYIDLLAVNLYPFQKTVQKKDVTVDQAIENIDIGGPAMIRAGAKNHHRMVVVVSPNQYKKVLDGLQKQTLDLAERRALALAAFQHTANYDVAISNWMKKEFDEATVSEEMSFAGKKKIDLRYGENPHQKAAFYVSDETPGTISGAKQLNGKALSYNNIVDLDAAWQLVNEWSGEQAACAIIKHTNPCGIALGGTVQEAYEKALNADPISAFGGIIAINQMVNKETAEKIIETFMEAVIAPDFDPEALTVLRKKENLRVLATGLAMGSQEPWIETISGGFLIQERDCHRLNIDDCRVVSKREPTSEEIEQLLFAWNVVKHVKSNAIVVAKDYQTLGVGAGQMNRVGACDIAFKQAAEKAIGSVLASDAFFPFRDSVDAAARAGISAIIQPGGSIRDDESIQAANEANMAMIFTDIRHFKH